MYEIRGCIESYLKTSKEYKKAADEALKKEKNFTNIALEYRLDFEGLNKAIALRAQERNFRINKYKFEAALNDHIFKSVKLNNAARCYGIVEEEYDKLEREKQKFFSNISKGRDYNKAQKYIYDECIQGSPFTFNEELELLDDLRLWGGAFFSSERYCACQICVLEHLYMNLAYDFICKENKPYPHEWVSTKTKLEWLYEFEMRHNDIISTFADSCKKEMGEASISELQVGSSSSSEDHEGPSTSGYLAEL